MNGPRIVTAVTALRLLVPTVLLAQQVARYTTQPNQSVENSSPSHSFGRHRFYVELQGNTAFGATLNYEYGISEILGVRLGAGLDLYSGTKIFPFTLSALLGTGSSKIEMAGGFLMATELESGAWHWDGSRVFASIFIGYRYQPRKGFMLRLGMIPVFWTNNQIPWVGLSLGTVS